MFENYNEADFIEKPPIALFSLIKNGMSDNVYVSKLLRFASQCGVKYTINETADNYHFHLYFGKCLILGEYAYSFVQLIQESDIFEMSVFCSSPQIIKATFTRSKCEKSDS